MCPRSARERVVSTLKFDGEKRQSHSIHWTQLDYHHWTTITTNVTMNATATTNYSLVSKGRTTTNGVNGGGKSS